MTAVAASPVSGREARLLATVLLAIEGVGIVAMVILARGGAPATGMDFSTFSFSGASVSAVPGGVVAAFLSWAGFEACASMGEETADPGRNIPRALIGTLALTGVLFVVVMFAQTIGFGTDKAGLEAFGRSANTLGDLGNSYIGEWFSLLVILAATVSAFGCHLATAATSGRMLFAFSRDGFGPKTLSHIDPSSGGPRRAAWLVVAQGVVVNVLCWYSGRPVGATGDPAIDAYFLFAVAGSVCLMVCGSAVTRVVLVRNRFSPRDRRDPYRRAGWRGVGGRGSGEVVEGGEHARLGVIGVVAVHRPVPGVVGEDGDLHRLVGQHDDGVLARAQAAVRLHHGESVAV